MVCAYMAEMWWVCVCLHVSAVPSEEKKAGICFPGAGVLGQCQLLILFWELSPSSLQKQNVLVLVGLCQLDTS